MDTNIVNNVISRMYSGKSITNEADRAINRLHCNKVLTFNYNSDLDTQVIDEPDDIPVYACKFCPTQQYGNILAVADENGTVSLLDVDTEHILHVTSHNNTIFDLNWMPCEKKYVTVSGDHSAKLWDLREGGVQLLGHFVDHSRSVKCVSFKPQNTAVFATGSRDGTVLLWDIRSKQIRQRGLDVKKSDQLIEMSDPSSRFRFKKSHYDSISITSLVFQDDNTLYVALSSERIIYGWDMRKTYSWFSKFSGVQTPKLCLQSPSSGFSNLCIDPTGSKLYANCMDSNIYCFNINTCDPEPIAAFRGHQNGTFYVKSSVSHDGRYLMSGSSNNYAYIWNTRGAERSASAVLPMVSLPGHTAEVTCIDMSSSGDMAVATCSDDGTYRLYRHIKSSASPKREDITEVVLFDDGLSKSQWQNHRVATTEEVRSCTPKEDLKICRYLSSACRRGQHGTDSPTVKLNIENRTPPARKTSKRKLSDLPEFTASECRKDKLSCRRPVLSPIKETGDNYLEDKKEKCRKEISDLSRRSCDLTINSELSSPTAGLPNYMVDGLSPYNHRCVRRARKSSDWLTTMQKTKYQATSMSDEKKSCGLSATLESTKEGTRRRTTRCKSQDDKRSVSRTLFQYFATSNKP